MKLWFGVIIFCKVFWSKSQKIIKFELFSKRTEGCQNLRSKILIIIHPKYIEIFGLTVLNI